MNAMSTSFGILLASFAMTAAAADPAHQPAKTRAQVQTELAAALARGERPTSGEAQPELPAPNHSGLRRVDVRNELLAALRAGYRPSAGEASYETPMANGAGRSRAEVANELRALIKQGVQLPRGEAS